MPSKIQWTDEVWNPVTGCTKISPGCASCYAERISLRFRRSAGPWIPKYEAQNVMLHPERLEIPLRWRKPRRIFVNSMSDLFHERVPDEFIEKVFAVMLLAQQHTFQILTKRPDRMREYISATELPVYFHEGGLSPRPANRGSKVLWEAQGMCEDGTSRMNSPSGIDMDWPLPNVWLGVSVENQYWADRRIPLLLQTPAAVRFVSAEPLLGPLDIGKFFHRCSGCGQEPCACTGLALQWLIVGGESGGREKRYMKMEWLEAITRQARAAGVPLFIKQDSGRLPGTWGRIPQHLRIREYPDALQGS